MNITLLSQWYPPEQAPFGHMVHELASYLSESGHTVSVITGYPNHPTGKLFKGYQKKLISKFITKEGVTVIRTWLYTSPDRSFLKRLYNFISFNATSHLALLGLRNQDIIYTTPQPLSIGISLPLLGLNTRSKIVYSLQDLHPQAAVSLGLIKNSMLIKSLEWVERAAYSLSAAILPISSRFKTHVVERGARSDTVFVTPNWIDEQTHRPLTFAESLRSKFKLKDTQFVLLYAGSTSKASGVDYLLKIAEHLPEMEVVIVGEGSELGKIKTIANEMSLANVKFFPFQDRDDVPKVQSIANLSILPMENSASGSSVPSKLLGYLSAGKPTICLGPKDTEVARIIEEYECGKVLSSRNPASDAREIKRLQENETLISQMGANARKTAVERFGKTASLSRIKTILESLSNPPSII